MNLSAKRAERHFYRLSALVLCLFALVTFGAAKSTLKNGTVIAKSPSAVALKPEGVRVSLELTPAERQKSQSLSARIAKPASGKSLYLVFKDLQTLKQPGELYNVYVNLAEGAKPDNADQPVGTLNFYNAGKTQPRSDLFFSFDVTEVLEKLIAEKQLSEPLTITIIPAERPAAGVIPTIGQIQLIEE